MKEMTLKPCPIGIQTFEKIRKRDLLYVDKTEYVYKLATSGAQFFFLSRPRRFGKSLLVSTMKAYFKGQRELFEGLKIARLETEWVKYPVLHFDMSMGKYTDKEMLIRSLGKRLAQYEVKYGVTTPAVDLNDRLTELIMAAYTMTGKQVVLLIDEYDAPLLDVAHEKEHLPELRNVMRNFYSPLKACDPYLRFVFMTGITKFSQLSIFSELNNISNISMDEEFAAVCGITKEEMLEELDSYIIRLAEKLGLTKDETVEKLTQKYDGYHFTWPSPDIYNPYSLFHALEKRKMDNYWFESGTPTFLIEMMCKFNVIPSQIGEQKAMAEEFNAPTESMESITPLMYQSGYLTIKEYFAPAEMYTLDIPNNEIRIGLMQSLLPKYVMGTKESGPTTIARMYAAITENDLDGMLQQLKDFLLTIPYCDVTNYEGHYQQMLYVIFSLLGRYVDVEVRTPNGRVDMVMRTAEKIYLFELKLNKSAQAAMEQIDLKNYSERFALCGLPIVKVGINFDSERHTITEWEIKEEQMCIFNVYKSEIK